MERCECCGLRVDILENHHIKSRSKGGTNRLYNITRICSNCHSSIHAGNIVIEGKFLTTNGYQLLWHHSSEESITNQSPDTYTWR